MGSNDTGLVQVLTSGEVAAGMPELAQRKVAAVLRHVSEPVLSARVMLTRAADPAVGQPAVAWAIISVNGRLVRASGVGATMRAAITQLATRLRIRLDRAWPDDRGRQIEASRRLRRLRSAGVGHF